MKAVRNATELNLMCGVLMLALGCGNPQTQEDGRTTGSQEVSYSAPLDSDVELAALGRVVRPPVSQNVSPLIPANLPQAANPAPAPLAPPCVSPTCLSGRILSNEPLIYLTPSLGPRNSAIQQTRWMPNTNRGSGPNAKYATISRNDGQGTVAAGWSIPVVINRDFSAFVTFVPRSNTKRCRPSYVIEDGGDKIFMKEDSVSLPRDGKITVTLVPKLGTVKTVRFKRPSITLRISDLGCISDSVLPVVIYADSIYIQ